MRCLPREWPKTRFQLALEGTPEQLVPDPNHRGLGGGCPGINEVPFRVPGLMGQAGNFGEGGQGVHPFGVQGIGGHQMGVDPRPPVVAARDRDLDPLRAQGLGACQGFAGRDEFSPGERTIWELPVLAEPDPSTSPIQLGDYLALIHPMMSDLAPASSVWWNRVLQESEAAYAQWQHLGPMRRGQLRVTLSAELSAPRFYRLESRATGMLMKSIPESAKQEVIASREMTTVSIIFRLLTIFQPGGMRERGILLAYLNSPGVAATPEEGVAMLRKWGRWISRARGMGASLPDASLLMAGLDQLSSQVLGTYPSISFRLNLIRTEYRLDHVPEHDTVVLYARSIQSEFEQAAISPSQGTSPKKPRVARADADAPKGGPQKGEQKGDSKKKGEQTQSHNQQPTAQGTGGKGDGAAKSNAKGQGGAQETQAGSNRLAGGKRPPCTFFLSDAGMDVPANTYMTLPKALQNNQNVGRVDPLSIGSRIAKLLEVVKRQSRITVLVVRVPGLGQQDLQLYLLPRRKLHPVRALLLQFPSLVPHNQLCLCPREQQLW